LHDLGLTHEIDLPRAIERLALGKAAQDLPHRRRRQWGAIVQIWIDTSSRLIPYLEDFKAIAAELTRRLGRDQVEVFSGAAPNGLVWTYQASRQRQSSYRLPPPGTHVLVLGDLGALDRESGTPSAEWKAFARRLRSRNCHPLALVPTVLGAVPAELKNLFRIHTLAPLRQVGDRSRGPEAIRQLLRLVSFAVRVEPGLLRDCRRLLPELADPGLESVVWQQPEFISRVWNAGTLGPRAPIERLIEEFEQLESIELRGRVLETFKRWRWRNGERGLGCEVFFEELSRLSEATRKLLPAADSADMEAGWRWLAETVCRYSPESRVPEVDYAWRVLQRDVVQTSQNSAVNECFARVRSHFEGDGVGTAVEPFEVHIVQHGARWMAERVTTEEIGRRKVKGSWVAALRARGPSLFLRPGPLAPSADKAVDNWQPIDIPAQGAVQFSAGGGGQLALRTDCEGVELDLRSQPDSSFVTAAGRDPFGLWEETLIPAKTGDPVRVRWRWIPPGTFWQGSPEDEPGRSSNEGPRHLVTLTQGFWMADTPCTQALWKGVMGKNPSEFQGDQHPVETVSWNTVQDFLTELNQLIPGLQASLPTEAQWEYACRAGSQTALYPTAVGDGTIEIVGEHKAPVLDPIAWYGGNSVAPAGIRNPYDSSKWPEKQIDHKQASTQPVKGRLPNAWGLYDMLGNVYEWCRAGGQKYGSGHAINPGESKTGDSVGSRVFRGGSWYSLARRVRCAIRFHGPADFVNRNLSFRLVRVQEKDREPGQQSSET
jgi:formylglycine-generating enzyme required for sulfatase activity